MNRIHTVLAVLTMSAGALSFAACSHDASDERSTYAENENRTSGDERAEAQFRESRMADGTATQNDGATWANTPNSSSYSGTGAGTTATPSTASTGSYGTSNTTTYASGSTPNASSNPSSMTGTAGTTNSPSTTGTTNGTGTSWNGSVAQNDRNRTTTNNNGNTSADRNANTTASNNGNNTNNGGNANDRNPNDANATAPNNDMLTAQDQSETDQDRDITARIRRAVVGNDGLSMQSKNVTIITRSRVVTLRGEVPNAREKQIIERAARRTRGVSRVDTMLQVAPADRD